KRLLSDKALNMPCLDSYELFKERRELVSTLPRVSPCFFLAPHRGMRNLLSAFRAVKMFFDIFESF
ncbi:hypothetical protein, partial [Lujinxingia vulgaris]|uniref:hypothetical protein n=1 Tax=Lujinxingia vulgaris TaxID=2600176 RepID=UPI001E5636C6